MKSERITFLATPEFKANLMQLAQRQNTSVGELIRGRFEHPLGRADIEQTELRALPFPLPYYQGRLASSQVFARLTPFLC